MFSVNERELTLLRGDQVDKRLGRSKTSRYEDIHAGLLVRPVRYGARAARYPAHEIDSIIAARIAGKRDGEIRQLVKELEAARIQDPGVAKLGERGGGAK